MTLGERISELRRKRSMTQPMLAKAMNVSQSTVASWENNRRAVSTEDIAKLSDLFHVSTDYLLGKTDQPDPLDKLIATTHKHMALATEPIQVYGTIHAGNAAWADEDIIGEVMVSPQFIQKYGYQNLFALQVNGESMNKRIPNGYVAVFAKDIEPESGDVVAVLIDGEDAMIKVFRRTSQAIIFQPDSWLQTFQTYTYRKDDEQDYRIIGKFLYATSECI
jgi:repressor LexA